MSKRFGLLIFLLALTGCGANDKILQSGKQTPSATPAPRTAIEDDLLSMQTANFHWVFVLRRKDGGPIDAQDRSVIKVNTAEANRRVSSDSDKAFVIGTNTQIPPEKMSALAQRFAIEDHSPAFDPNANANANANVNANVNSGK